MLRRTLIACALILLAAPALAGVVLEFETHGENGEKLAESHKLYAQGDKLRMELKGMEQGGNATVLFQGDAIVVLNERDRTYYRIDKETLEKINSQMSSMMEQMKAQMANLPPEQRETIEKMMKNKGGGASMQGGLLSPPKPAPRIESEGREEAAGYLCRKYSIYSGSDKMMELLAAAPGEVGAAAEAEGALRAMAEFTQEMMEAFQDGPMAGAMGDQPFRWMNDIEGFPVVTREIEGGRVVQEVRLKSATPEQLDDGVFSPPPEYREAQMGPGMR